MPERAIRVDLEEKALAANYRTYEAVCSIWREIDTKAQGTITVAGIFVAATFAVITRFPSHFSMPELWTLRMSIGSLVLSVVASLAALWVRKFDYPPTGQEIEERMADTYSVCVENGKERTPERVAELEQGILSWSRKRWADTIAVVEANNHKKAACLVAAQVFLVVAVVATSSLTALLVK